MIGLIVFIGFLMCVGFLRMMFREGRAIYGISEASESTVQKPPTEAELEFGRAFNRFSELMDQLYGDPTERPTPKQLEGKTLS